MESLRESILKTIIFKSNLKQRIYDNTFTAFNLLKETLFEMASEMDDALEGKLDRRVRLEYRDRGKFETQLQVAGDLLLFQMQSNIFIFEDKSPIWNNEYVAMDRANAYCGVINIYNFLADSFKLNRNADEGYLIGRIFINGANQYFVEGKRHFTMRHDNFGERELNRTELVEILETALLYSLNFDPLVPPYDAHKRVKVDQFNSKMDNSKFETGKRLDYDFKTDDI